MDLERVLWPHLSPLLPSSLLSIARVEAMSNAMDRVGASSGTRGIGALAAYFSVLPKGSEGVLQRSLIEVREGGRATPTF